MSKTAGTKRIVMMGAGAFARETLWAVNEIKEGYGQYSVTGFLDDDESKRGKPVLPGSEGAVTAKLIILGSLDHIIRSGFSDYDFILPAIGTTEAKKSFTERILACGCRLPGPVIHRSVELGHDNVFGDGTIMFAGSTVTVNSVLGLQVNVNPQCSIAHDVVIEDYCNLSPGVHLTGGVHLEEGVNIGTGAVILPRVTIGKWSVIGAGAVVTKDIPPYSVAAGVPAKIIKTRN
ncbi:MAG TPA: acetyltransferase [Ignavibacteria bacterium]|nr:acetyltransferase [Ignavibacteria bacterium]HMQ97569.1 acetyltransferase [Ignavibacteria bacterium]